MMNIDPSTYYFWASITSITYGVYAAFRYYSVSGVDLINTKDAKKMIKTGGIKNIIDVRTKTEWNMGHFKNAIHIPINDINEKSTKKLKKEEGILTYCNTGQRARAAAERLKELGFKKVYYIDGTYTGLN
jgi:rhodanese-related sulfurtransferase